MYSQGDGVVSRASDFQRKRQSEDLSRFIRDHGVSASFYPKEGLFGAAIDGVMMYGAARPIRGTQQIRPRRVRILPPDRHQTLHSPSAMPPKFGLVDPP
jgi:hypothetical protein